MKHDICNKDYSEFVDILRYKDINPGKRDRDKFSSEQISRLWELSENPYYQIILMLIYNGCRISEFLDLKKEHVHLDEQYFDVIAWRTEAHDGQPSGRTLFGRAPFPLLFHNNI